MSDHPVIVGVAVLTTAGALITLGVNYGTTRKTARDNEQKIQTLTNWKNELPSISTMQNTLNQHQQRWVALPNVVQIERELIELSDNLDDLPPSSELTLEALTSMRRQRKAMTVMVQERAWDLVNQTLLRGSSARDLAEMDRLKQIAAAVFGMYETDRAAPDIFLVIEKLDDFIAFDPQSSLGSPESEVLRITNARSAVEDVLTRAPEDTQALINTLLSVSYLSTRIDGANTTDNAKALAYAEAALKIRPQSPAATNLRCIASMHQHIERIRTGDTSSQALREYFATWWSFEQIEHVDITRTGRFKSINNRAYLLASMMHDIAKNKSIDPIQVEAAYNLAGNRPRRAQGTRATSVAYLLEELVFLYTDLAREFAGNAAALRTRAQVAAAIGYVLDQSSYEQSLDTSQRLPRRYDLRNSQAWYNESVTTYTTVARTANGYSAQRVRSDLGEDAHQGDKFLLLLHGEQRDALLEHATTLAAMTPITN